MFALVDCNNFYASCERVFNPSLRDKPIVVLSNNDGCVIARSNEVKKLGIKMGVPAYQIKEEIERHHIYVFSSNYTLYGDMSARVMAILQHFSPEMEIYSIDEAFLNLTGLETGGLKEYGEQVTATVKRSTGIPVSMGIAPTKTLAKVANKFAKKYPAYHNVCMIDSEERRVKSLSLTDIGDVWGIGGRYNRFLRGEGVTNAYEFSCLSQSWVRKYMTVVGERMWRELNGEPCIDMETAVPKKKQICTSRAFGSSVADIEELSEAVACYASVCAEKLRRQHGYAVSLMVFIHTNNFREDLPQYCRNRVIELPVPTDDTMEIVHYALAALRDIYREGYLFKKAGVIITEIIDRVQMNLFDTVNRKKQAKFMRVVDHMNRGFTDNRLTLAVQSGRRKWKLKQECLSPCYSTRMTDIININCK